MPDQQQPQDQQTQTPAPEASTQVAPTQEPEQQAPVNEVEARAREQGWVAKEEWVASGRDPADWRPADIFVDRGELLGKIKSQSSEMRELKSMVTYLAQQNQKLYEAGYQRAIAELEAARDQAVEASDHKAVRELDRQIREHEKAMNDVKKAQPTIDPNLVRQQAQEHYEEFISRNPWYTKDEALQDWANGAAVKIRSQNPTATDKEIYRLLEQNVRKTFPDKFKRVGAPSPDGASNRSAGSPARKDGNSDFEALLAELPEAEAQIARNLVKRGHVTKEKFMQDFQLVNGRR